MPAAPEVIRVEVPAPATAEEREEARTIGRWVNPAHHSPEPPEYTIKRKQLEPDSPVLAQLFALANALWHGEAVTVEFTGPFDAAARDALDALAGHVNPSDATYVIRDTAIGAALIDLHFHVRAALTGVPVNAARCAELLDDALWNLGASANVDDKNDRPLAGPYSEALSGGAYDPEAITAERDRLRQRFADAEKAMDNADRQLEEMARPGEPIRPMGVLPHDDQHTTEGER